MTEHDDKKFSEQAEKQSLRDQLDLMGITYSGNAGVERLRTQLNEALAVPEEAKMPEEIVLEAQGLTDAMPAGAHGELLTGQQYLDRQARELKRVVVNCNNPMKENWPGELFDVGNSTDVAKRKYVPYGVEYHVPNMILEHIREKKCQVFVKRLDNKGREVMKGKLIQEYNITDLPPLTVEEREKLALTQAMREGRAA